MQPRVEYVGLAGAGFDTELEILDETSKAFRLSDETGKEFWMPKKAFDDDGALFKWAIPMLIEKLED